MTTSNSKTYFPGIKTYRVYPLGLDGRAMYRGGQNYRYACEFWGQGWSGKTEGEAVIGAMRLFFGLKAGNASEANEPEILVKK